MSTRVQTKIQATPEQKAQILESAYKHSRDIELHLDILEDIRKQMVQLIPFEGPLDRFITVLLGVGSKHGNSVGPHAHKGWTCVYYPFGADVINIDNTPYHPEVDEAIVIPPNVVHEVPITDKIRLSVAVVIATPEGAG
jgi:hypothetical protein